MGMDIFLVSAVGFFFLSRQDRAIRSGDAEQSRADGQWHKGRYRYSEIERAINVYPIVWCRCFLRQSRMVSNTDMDEHDSCAGHSEDMTGAGYHNRDLCLSERASFTRTIIN